METRIRKILSSVLDVSEEKLDKNSSAMTIESWDSLNHMKLVVALEEELNVTFTDQEILEMQSLALIEYAVKEALKR